MPIVVRIPAAARDEEALVALVDAGAAAVEAEGEDLLGLFHQGEGEEALGLVHALLPGAAPRAEPAAMVDWDSVWVASLRPVRLGSLVIAGVGQPAPPDALVLETGPAFGSARHPTTRLCLEWLLARRTEGSVLDLGTGNGVLALAALRLGAARAVGVDTEPEALQVAARNAARAGLAERLHLHSAVPEGRRFDRVVANVLAAPLVAMAPQLARWAGSGAELALSGFGAWQRPEVVAALRHVGLRVVGGDEAEGWCRVDAFAPW